MYKSLALHILGSYTHLTFIRTDNSHPTMSAEASSSTQTNGNGEGGILKTQYTPEQIQAFNKQLEDKTPQEILVWAIDNLDGLYQTTAFGL